jgi:hypothetical protein
VAFQAMIPPFLVAFPWCIVVLSQTENGRRSIHLMSLLSLLPIIHLIFTVRFLAYKSLFAKQSSSVAVAILMSFTAAELLIIFMMLGNGCNTIDWILWPSLTSMAVSGLIYTILVTVYRTRPALVDPDLPHENDTDDEYTA